MLAKKLNGQRNVEVDYALVEDGDHMYNGHLTDLYKITGNYVIGAMQRKKPLKKRRGRRRKLEQDGTEEDTPLLAAGEEEITEE